MATSVNRCGELIPASTYSFQNPFSIHLAMRWDQVRTFALPGLCLGSACSMLQTSNQEPNKPNPSDQRRLTAWGTPALFQVLLHSWRSVSGLGEEAETKIQGRRWEVWTVQDKWTFTLTFVLGICCQNIWIIFLLVLEIFTKPSWAGTDEHPCGTITTLVSNKIDGLLWWRGMSLQLSFQLGGI